MDLFRHGELLVPLRRNDVLADEAEIWLKQHDPNYARDCHLWRGTIRYWFLAQRAHQVRVDLGAGTADAAWELWQIGRSAGRPRKGIRGDDLRLALKAEIQESLGSLGAAVRAGRKRTLEQDDACDALAIFIASRQPNRIDLAALLGVSRRKIDDLGKKGIALLTTQLEYLGEKLDAGFAEILRRLPIDDAIESGSADGDDLAVGDAQGAADRVADLAEYRERRRLRRAA